jgi:peptide chain release factor 2
LSYLFIENQLIAKPFFEDQFGGDDMEKYEIVKAVENFKERLQALKDVIGLEGTITQIKQNESLMLESGFWDNARQATTLVQKTNELKDSVSTYDQLSNRLNDLEMILELDDESLFGEVDSVIAKMDKDIEEFEVKWLLSGEYDRMNAIVDLHPGAGGTEAQDWALMLFRMYKRFAERHNFEFELIDYQEALEAGIKSVTFSIKGKNAYGIMKCEKGVHRLIRISPFDSNARRHTSFASCTVIPEIDDQIEVNIRPEDIKVDTYRSSGAGGQHVNKTDSAVRLTHLKTGIVVTCQNERSQIQNRERAMQVLKSKLFQLEIEERQNKIDTINGDLSENTFGSQIRSYILHPYAMVKDHRTDVESSNPQAVLDGDLDIFINAYLRKVK